MSFLFRIAYMAFISLTVVGFLSSTSDWGDFLNTGISPDLWGVVTVVSAVLAVVAHIRMWGTASPDTTIFGFLMMGGLSLVHGLVFLAMLVPTFMAAMVILTGGISIGTFAAVISAMILVIPLTPYGFSAISDLRD